MHATTISENTRANGWAPLRQALGAQAFGLNAFTQDTGGQLVPKHVETGSGQEELYVVVAGRATFTIDGEELDAPAGTLVLAPPEQQRAAVAAEDGTTVLIVGARAGAAYRPRAFETNAIVIELFGEGKIEEARELLLSVPEGEYEDGESIAYNLACCEARLGDSDKALDHLRTAIAGRSDLVELARADDDLAALRDDPRFAELVSTPG